LDELKGLSGFIWGVSEMPPVCIGGNFDEMGSGNFGYETGLVWHISLFYLGSRRSREGKRRIRKALSMYFEYSRFSG